MGIVKLLQIKVLSHPEVIFIFLRFIILFQFSQPPLPKKPPNPLKIKQNKKNSENLSIENLNYHHSSGPEKC